MCTFTHTHTLNTTFISNMYDGWEIIRVGTKYYQKHKRNKVANFKKNGKYFWFGFYCGKATRGKVGNV